MCGLFGVLSYGKTVPASLERLVEELGYASTARGTDATGIAYNKIDKEGKVELVIEKEPVSAFKFKFRIPSGVRAVMGHTRRTTKGNEKFNYNNHPFRGKIGDTKFAFAHNGVLDNDYDLKRELNLPKTKIETDSYVAVQVLETQPKFNIDAIKYMAEKVEGMFTFTILDDEDNLWVVKNDSPFAIAHFPELQMYVYASTEDLLFEALTRVTSTRSVIIDAFRKGTTSALELIFPKKGQILCIKNDGNIVEYKFEPQERWSKQNDYWKRVAGATTYGVRGSSYYDDFDWDYGWNYNRYGTGDRSVVVTTTAKGSTGGKKSKKKKAKSGGTGLSTTKRTTTTTTTTTTVVEERSHLLSEDDDPYFQQVVEYATRNFGIEEEELQMLRDEGFTWDDIEQSMWDGSIWDYIDEIKARREQEEFEAAMVLSPQELAEIEATLNGMSQQEQNDEAEYAETTIVIAKSTNEVKH